MGALPDWYINGLISYVRNTWNVQIDNRVRDGIITKKYLKFNHLSGEDAIYAGHSIWKYIVDTYTESAVSNLLYMTRINRNIESVRGGAYGHLNQAVVDLRTT